MPLPKPNPNESEDEFIERCMGSETMQEEYPDSEQRAAVCYSQWEKKDMANQEYVELFIYDQIGEDWYGGISDAQIVKALADAGDKPVRVRINSPGGDVFKGLGIYNALTRHKAGVEVEIDSVAASAASLVAMAGSKIRIAENARIMIHRAWTIAAGNVDDMLKTADLLESIDGTLIDTYAARTGQSKEQIKEWVDAETWMTADEAVERGFADEIGQRLNVKACVKLLRNVPQDLLKPTWDEAVTAAAEASREPPTQQESIYSPEHVRRIIDFRTRLIRS